MDRSVNGGTYYFDDSSVLKYLRKVLAEINPIYVDCGLRAAFLLKRYIEKYDVFEDPKRGPKLVLLCMLKDIGTYYKNGVISRKNHCLAAASSYAFMHNCSPFGDYAKPLLFYQSKYLPDTYDEDQQAGLLMSLASQIVEYNYQEYTIDEMVELIKNDTRGIFNPEQAKKMFKLMREDYDIFEKLNDRNSLFIYETSKYISSADYSVEELLGFIDMATFAIEFHNNETLAHTVTVASLAEELAKLSKLPESMIAEIRLAALVHDIGKIRVPLEILCYPGKLSPEQYKEMSKHVEYTREIITGCFSYKIVDIASHHHEKLDGSGYPDGLRERDLSIGDKIIAIADITSALYCKRSYKESFNENKIKDILKGEVEKGRLDRRIVNHLLINWDEIMPVMKSVEKDVLDQYNAMKVEFEKLSKSKVLEQLFDYVDNYRSIFDDEEEIVEEEEAESDDFESYIANLEEKSEEPEEVIEEEVIEEEIVEEEESESDDFESYIASLAEKDAKANNSEENVEEIADNNENIEPTESEEIEVSDEKDNFDNDESDDEEDLDDDFDGDESDDEDEEDDDFDGDESDEDEDDEDLDDDESDEDEDDEDLDDDESDDEDEEDDDFDDDESDDEEDDEDFDDDESDDEDDEDLDEDEDLDDDESDDEDDEDLDDEVYGEGWD